jgi:hypothetical protein
MRLFAQIVAILLGLLFLFASVAFFLGMAPKEPPPKPMPLLMDALGPTGYLFVVKVFELIGGLLVMVPLTRNLGLLVLGPIIVNIIIVHVLFMAPAFGPGAYADPMMLFAAAAALFLMFFEAKAWLGLIVR